MKAYFANPDYSDANSNPYWTVVNAEKPEGALNDLTKLSVGTILAPTSDSTTGYFAANVEDLSRLMKGWSFLTKQTLGGRNTSAIAGLPSVTALYGETSAYVDDISGFTNGDTFVVLEGQKSGFPTFSSDAVTTDNAKSEWATVRNAGLIATTMVAESQALSFSLPSNPLDITATLEVPQYIDSSGNTPVPTPDNLNGGVNNWYVNASGSDEAASNLLTLLPDFTVGGAQVTKVVIGSASAVITLSSANTAFVVGQTVTIVTNGTGVSTTVAHSTYGYSSMGWYAGRITGISGGNTILTTDLTDATSGTSTNPLTGSLNDAVVFSGTVSAGTLSQVTVTAFADSADFGLAVGQTVTGAGFTDAIITAVTNNGIGMVITLDTAQTAGTYATLSSVYSDSHVMAFGATLDSATVRLNQEANEFDCSYFTTPYYTVPSELMLGTVLSTASPITSLSVLNQTFGDKFLTAGNTIALLSGDNYQEVVVATTTTAVAGASTSVPVNSFTPNFAFPAFTAIYTNLDDQHSRYGRDLVFPVRINHYNNQPVAKFKSMTALSGGFYAPSNTILPIASITSNGTIWTVTFTGSDDTIFTGGKITLSGITGLTGYNGTWTIASNTGGGTITIANTNNYGSPTANQLTFASATMNYSWGTYGGTYYSSDAYTVAVDSVANIYAGQTLTFRDDYTPSDAPYTWSLAGAGISGITTVAGSPILGVPDGTANLPLKVGQYIGSGTNGTIGKFIVSWTSNSITVNSGTGITLNATPFNARIFAGTSGSNSWKVYSVNPLNNTFVIYGSYGGLYTFSNTAYANGDNKNYIFQYNNQLYDGNTLDTTLTTHSGAGVVGLNSSVGIGWHDINTVVGSYQGGARYIGSQSVGDQEQVIPFRLGSIIGTTLSSDITAQTSVAFTTNPLPNTAVASSPYGDPSSWSFSDINQYNNRSFDLLSWAGFANIASDQIFNTNTNSRAVVVVGQGETQEMVTIVRPAGVEASDGVALGQTVDGSNTTNAPIIWHLDANQEFQYDHLAGEPVSAPNFIYQSPSTINHAKNTPVLGTPDGSNVYDSTTGATNYRATAALVATNLTQEVSVTAETKIGIAQPWLASGNQGQPNIATSLAGATLAGGSTLTLADNHGFATSYPSIYQSGIYYLPPELGRLIGTVASGATSIPVAITGEMPTVLPFFIRIGGEVVQVIGTDKQLVSGSSTQYNLTFTLATATTQNHQDFTPLHLNSLPIGVKYRSMSVPHFYLAGDISRTGGNFSTNTISTNTIPNTLGNGQTITGTGIPSSTVVSSHGTNGASGTIAMSKEVTAFVQNGTTFTNKYAYGSSYSRQTILNSSRSFTASAGTPSLGVLPTAGSVMTGTGMASPTYLSGYDAGNNRIAISANPTSFGSPTLTSTLTFTATTTVTNTTVTLVSVTVNGTVYSKAGTTNPTWNGQTIGYYIKAQAPITTASAGGIAGRFVSSVSTSAGTFVVSGATTGITAATGATITSAIGFTADTGRSIVIPYANNTEIDKLFVAGVTVSDATNSYIQTGTTITTVQPMNTDGTLTYEVLLNQAMATTTPWSGQTITLSNTFTGATSAGNTITNLSSTAGITVGSVISGNQYTPNGTTVTAVNTGYLTLSKYLTNTSPQSSQTFSIAGSLAIGKAYTSLSTTPLPCYIPSGTTLNILFGDHKQKLVTSANANAGDTSISVQSFTPRYNYLMTTMTNGVPVNADGSYSLGAVLGVGLASDLEPNQVMILSANGDPNYTLQITTSGYAQSDAIVIATEPFTSNFAFDGQSVGFSFTASTTEGSNSITLSGAVSGLTVGQQVFSSDLMTNQPCFVTAISGLTVTLSNSASATNASSTIAVYSTTLTASYPMVLGSGTSQETVYPISVPVATNGYYTVNISSPTVYQHNSGEAFVYYQYPSSLQAGDTTYRPDLGKFVMFDGIQWRTARINNVQGLYSVLGAFGGGDLSNITLFDPTTGKETAPDTFTGTSSTSFSNYFGGHRSTDPSGNEWTADSVARSQFHFKVKVPQGKSIAYRSIALRAEFKSAPTVAGIHFSPSDNFEIAPDITNSVVWNYSDMDNEPQTGWEIKIFDDYTYHLDNFSADKSTPVWQSNGNDDTSEVEINTNNVSQQIQRTGILPWVNGQSYWTFIRVAKQFQQKQWWGDWQSKRFVAITEQPSAPIMSIYSDNTNAVNTIVIQSTDNLLGKNNGGFAGGLGQWSKSSNDTTSSTVRAQIDGIALSSGLSESTAITSLPVGAVGYVLTQGALSGTGLGSFKVSGSSTKATDPLGFPTSGRFWITIGTEKLLVSNNMDGNNNGDTFTIITRGYLGTVAASHATGSSVTFALQNDVYVGSTATIDWKHQVVTDWSTTSQSVVRWSRGGQAATSTPVNKKFTIHTQTQGADRNKTDHCVILDPTHTITKKDIGSTAVLQFNHWRVAGGANQISDDGTTVTSTKPSTLNLGATIGPATVEMTISGVTDVWDSTAHNNILKSLGSVTAQVAGSRTQPVKQLSVRTLVGPSFSTDDACISYMAAGTTLILRCSVINDPIKNKSFNPPDMKITLTQDWHFSSKTLQFKPVGVGNGWQVGDGSSFIIPVGTVVMYQPPVQRTTRKIIHFKGKYSDKKGFAHQKLQTGDYLFIKKTKTTPAVAPTSSGTNTRTIVTPHHQVTDVDSQQSLVVDFLTQPTTAINGTIGSLSGTTFTANTTQTTFNAIKYTADPGSITGAQISALGLLPNTTVRAKTTVSGGYAITFNDNTGSQISGTTQYSSATGGTGTAPSSPITTGIDAVITPLSSMVIPAGSTSIPVKAFLPKFAFPAYTPVRLHYPTLFGENVLVTDPTTGTGTSGDISAISTYPANWSFTDQNPIAVNAGVTYGLAGFSKIIAGSGTPTFLPRIDWYDEIGNLLKSSYGTESLNNAGTINSVTIGAPLNTTTSSWGQGWTPVAMVAVAPKNQNIGTTTNFTSLSSSTGTFTVGGGGATIALKAGSVFYNASGVAFTTTSAVLVNATSIPVRFLDGLSVSSTNTLYISATRAVCAFHWQYANAGDAYGLSGVMFKALSAPVISTSNTTSSTEIPKLTSTVTVGANKAVSAIALPATTPIAGENTLYVFDPVGDYATREVHYGGSANNLWTSTTSAVSAGDTSVRLSSIAGIGVGTQLKIDYQNENSETVTVSSSWLGGGDVTISAPGFVNAHASGVKVYSLTAGLSEELTTTQTANTSVAVFNWGNDGYISSSHGSYIYHVERSDDNGVTWSVLRNGGSALADDTGVAVLTDYEVIPNKTIYYRATPAFVADPNSGLYTEYGVPTEPTLAPVLVSNTWWLASTSDDTLRYPMIVKTGYSETQRHPSGVFYPLGSSRPITISGVVTGRDGSLTVVWTDNANFENFLALINKGETLILTNPVESDRKYIFINQDVSITHNAAASPYREISINYVEAAPPHFGYTYGS